MSTSTRKPRNSIGTKLKYTFKSDVLFKMFFVRHPGLLKRLVAVLLAIPLESIVEFELTNTEMPPEEIKKKFCKLDLNMVVDGRKVNLEIQVDNEGNIEERLLFHWARLYSAALPAVDDYALLPRTIVIGILGFRQYECQEVHSEFAVLEVTRHTPMTDRLAMHTFELPKLAGIDAIDAPSEKDLWLALFNAETAEELDNLVKIGGAVMSQAVDGYRVTTSTGQYKYLEEMRAKTRHDEAQALRNAERKRDQHWQAVVAEQKALIADREAENERLRLELAELRAKHGQN